jgi:hypothetical protein
VKNAAFMDVALSSQHMSSRAASFQLARYRVLVAQSSWVPYGYKIQWPVVGGESQGSLYLIVMEGPHRHSAQIESHSLQQQVLAGMASLQLDISLSTRAVFALGALVEGSDDENRWGLSNPILQ